MHCWAIEALFDHLICAAQQRRRDRRNVGNERPYPCYATITLAAARLAAIGARELEHRVRDRARSRSEPHGLDVPVTDGGEPSERPPSVGYHALAAVKQ